MSLFNALKIPSKFVRLKRHFGNKAFTLLDAGSGNKSATDFKTYFPNGTYHGIDLVKDYNYVDGDFDRMDAFYEMDLTKLDYDAIPDNHFDALLMAHIIEHLHNGDEVIKKLTPKLKSGAVIYVEYPGEKSTTLPSRKGTLNFYDDDTHVRVYSVPEISTVLEESGFEVIAGGTRRSWRNILMMPIKFVHNRIKYGYIMASVFWDWYGFAEFVWARKK
ncbi:MAG: methyltransferase domain-containing protein [Bacteroidia bacterium]|nr:methyltransferase domain-containing protein [Bacteroidia bacterium]